MLADMMSLLQVDHQLRKHHGRSTPTPFLFKFLKSLSLGHLGDASCRVLKVGPLRCRGDMTMLHFAKCNFFIDSFKRRIYGLNNRETAWPAWWLMRRRSLTWDLLKGNMREAETFGDASFPHLAAVPRLDICSGCHGEQWKSTNESL